MHQRSLPARCTGPILALLLLALPIIACTEPQGEWKVSQGIDYPTERVQELERGQTSAGEVISILGVPYGRRPGSFVYAVQYTRPVERNFVIYARAYTEQVTHRTFIAFDEGRVATVEDQQVEQYIPAGPRRW